MPEFHDLMTRGRPSDDDINAALSASSFEDWPELIRVRVEHLMQRAVALGKAPEDWKERGTFTSWVEELSPDDSLYRLLGDKFAWFRTSVIWPAGMA